MLQIRFLRKCLNMKFIYYGLMILSVSLNFETLLFGDDVSPPAWRGKQRTTYQVWDFAASGPAGSEGAEGPGYTTNLAPDVVTNAYGTPSLALSTGNFGSGWYDNSDASWSFLWGDKQGLWDIGDGSMTVVVPNLSSTNANVSTYVNATWANNALFTNANTKQVQSVTDEQGHYRIGDLPPGRYRIEARNAQTFGANATRRGTVSGQGLAGIG